MEQTIINRKPTPFFSPSKAARLTRRINFVIIAQRRVQAKRKSSLQKDPTSLTVKVSFTDPVVSDAEEIRGACSRDGSKFEIDCSLWERSWEPKPYDRAGIRLSAREMAVTALRSDVWMLGAGLGGDTGSNNAVSGAATWPFNLV